MSQSDYIKYKRVSTELRIDNNAKKMPPVINQSDYNDYREYTLENATINTKPVLNRLTPKGAQIVFNMDKVVTGCPTFEICRNTQSRPNRSVHMSSAYFIPTPQPLSWKKVKTANQHVCCK